MNKRVSGTATAAFIGLALAASNASAATLDFSDFFNGDQGTTTLVLPEATLNSFSGNFYIGAAAIASEPCALNSTNLNCEGDFEILFNETVNNLSFETINGGLGDQVDIYVYGSGGFMGSVQQLSSGLVDLSSFINVTRLFLDDSSTAGGFAYDYFNFDIGAINSDVPAPAPLAILGLGLVGLGLSRRKKTA